MVVIAVILIGVYLVFSEIRNNELQTQLANQEKCNQDGSKYFDDYKNKTAAYNVDQPLVTLGSEPTSDNNPFHIYAHELYKFDEPVFYFNNQLNTCLVLISYKGSTHAHYNGTSLVSVFDSQYKYIIDIYSNKTLASSDKSAVSDFQQQEKILLNQ